MDNKLLVEAISALDNVGFDIKAVAEQNDFTLIGVTHNPNRIVNKAGDEPLRKAMRGNVRYPGESYDIGRITGAADWREAISLASSLLQEDRANEIHVGDFLFVSFEVPAAEHKGVKFPKLKIENKKIQVIARTEDTIVFNFEEIIFESVINASDTNAGGFADSALSFYLNTEFASAMGISEFLTTNHDGMNYSLLSANELFGGSEYWYHITNWNDGGQIPYFKNEKNRVKTFEDETAWYWTSSPRASSAAHFCNVITNGHGYYSNASSSGGAAPVFCVA